MVAARRAAWGSSAAGGPVVAVAAWKKKWRHWARRQASDETGPVARTPCEVGGPSVGGLFPGMVVAGTPLRPPCHPIPRESAVVKAPRPGW
eukprot:11010418-Alexandrium_andersonii.AAC.1